MTTNSPYHINPSAETGLDKIFVRVAETVVAIESRDAELKLTGGPLAQFLVVETLAEATIQARWWESGKIELGEKIFDSGGIWQLYRNGQQYLFEFLPPLPKDSPRKIARFASDFTFGEIFFERSGVTSTEPIYPLMYPLDELLFMNLLSKGRGVEVHACGLSDRSGEGYLFIGQSGAGKSTTARLWLADPTVKILTDERVVLRKSDEQIFMYGTPWHGDAGISSPDKAPLNKVFFLRHWHENEMIRLGQTEAAARFFACSFPPFYNSEGLDFTLNFFAETVKSVPAYELRFVPDVSAVEFVRQSQHR